jgi:hypothetical protein
MEKFCDMEVIISPRLTVKKQHRFPKSKRRRIRAKWEKRECNFKHLPDPNYYIMSDTKTIVMHPALWVELKGEVAVSANTKPASAGEG